MCGEALGAAAKSVLHLQKDRCFKEQKICSNSSTLPAGDDVRWAQGVSVRSVLHLQKTRSLRSTKSAEALQHFYFLLGMMCHGARSVPARSVLHLQKTRCFKEQKICGSSSALLLLTGNDVPWGAGCASQERSAFAEGPLLGRCRESCAGTGCRLSELDRLPVSRIFQCELRQAVPNFAQIFRPLQKAARTSKQQKHSGWNCLAPLQPESPI